jgi:predicted Zn-dependent protease
LLLLPALVPAQTEELSGKSRQAKELMASGRYSEAIPIYESLVRAVPGNAGLLFNLGMAQHLSGQDQKAVLNLEAALKLQPDLTPAREVLAEAWLAQQSLERAAEEYRALANSSPQNPRVWHGLGSANEGLAVKNFESLLRAAPESAYVLHLLGTVKAKQSQNAAAEQLLKQAIARMPSLHVAHAALAALYRGTDRSGPADAEDRLAQGPCSGLECDFEGGRYLEVIRKTKGVNTPAAYFWRVQAYNELSLQAFSQLGKLPDSPELHEVKAQIMSSRGQHAEAAQEWREVIRLAPGNANARRELATSLYLSHDYQAALPALREELKAAPEDAALNVFVGDTLLHLEDAENALPYLEKAARLEPRLPGAHASLGLAYGRIGKPEKAIPHLKAALAADADGTLHYQLSRAYQATGQTELARQALAEYQKLKERALSQ